MASKKSHKLLIYLNSKKRLVFNFIGMDKGGLIIDVDIVFTKQRTLAFLNSLNRAFKKR